MTNLNGPSMPGRTLYLLLTNHYLLVALSGHLHLNNFHLLSQTYCHATGEEALNWILSLFYYYHSLVNDVINQHMLVRRFYCLLPLPKSPIQIRTHYPEFLIANRLSCDSVTVLVLCISFTDQSISYT